MAIFDQEHRPPEADELDTAHAVARVLLGALPIVGAPASELLNRIVAPPLERRRDEWMEDVGAALRKMEETGGLNLEALRDNPAFIDVAMQATQAALRTSREEKRAALRNALLNSAGPGAPDVQLQLVFVSIVDAFTDWHLTILSYFANPREWFQRNNPEFRSNLTAGSPLDILRYAYPEIVADRALFGLVWNELYTRGLVNTSNLVVTMSAGGMWDKRTTPLGDKFLKYIDSPE
jgi:hypothetical protein